ncbi:MAG: RsmE family RNA methyltransferase [Candidatus Korobacteraceae bacterium]
MTRRRWIADEFSSHSAALTGTNAAHLARTLRAHVGQQFDVACGERVYRATVSSVGDDRVEFDLGVEISAGSEVVPVTLLLAVFKFDRMEWAIEKATELNVASIVPVIARRTEKHLAQAAEKRVERWRRIALEAAQQSRRSAAPEIASPQKLGDALQFEDETKIVLAENERGTTLSEALRSGEVQSLALAVGPEGGWMSDELAEFAHAGWISASLGETILRAETAAIAGMAIARAELG